MTPEAQVSHGYYRRVTGGAGPNSTFINCLGRDGPRDWNPPDPVPDLIDTWYFGRALAAMDRQLEVEGLTVYLTFDVDELPSYGDDVVAVLIGDEWARTPAYLPRVLAVFRNLSPRPNLGVNPLAWPSPETLSSLLPAGRAALKAVPGRLLKLRAELGAARRKGTGPAPQVEVPVGTYNVLDLPIRPPRERGSDLFFAGSVIHAPSRSAALRARVMPKSLSRESMLRNVERMEARGGVVADMRLTVGFQASAASDPAEYSEALMDARFALVPRGAVTETHRFFQALKYGCVIVTETRPPGWFYERAPAIRLRHWDELEDALRPVLADPKRLETLHAQSLAWWEHVCSEEAVGRLMAHTLNALARDVTR